MLANLTSCDPDTDAQGQRETAALREGDRMRGRQMDGWRECWRDGVNERQRDGHQQSETFTIKQRAAAKSDFKERENTTNKYSHIVSLLSLSILYFF